MVKLLGSEVHSPAWTITYPAGCVPMGMLYHPSSAPSTIKVVMLKKYGEMFLAARQIVSPRLIYWLTVF